MPAPLPAVRGLRRRRRLGVVAALALVIPAPALAAPLVSPAALTLPGEVPVPPGEPVDDAAAGGVVPLPVLPPELDTPEMQALRAEADAARAELTEAAQRVSDAEAAARGAQTRADVLRTAAARAQADVDAVSDQIADAVRGAYTGSAPVDVPGAISAAADGTLTDRLDALTVLEGLREGQNDELEESLQLATRARDAASDADAAALEARDAEGAARAEGDAVSARAAETSARLQESLTSAVTGVVAQADAYPNGLLPSEVLCSVGIEAHELRCDAAAAFSALAERWAADHGGEQICLTDTYRSYAAQVDVFARKPGLAAVPGTSNHGRGVAVDLCGGLMTAGTPEDTWMQATAPAFGWTHPDWAEPGGSRPEPWHWEFTGGTPAP